MKKVLIPVMHRKDRSPSQRFRYEQYISHLEENGFEIHLSNILSADDDKLFYKPGNYFFKLKKVISSAVKRFFEASEGYDLVFIQREAFMMGTAFFEKRFAKSGTKLIYDFDDSIWLDNPQNTSDANRKLAFLKNPNKISQIIGVSDMVFAGNQYLADYASQFNGNVKIIPTTIDTDEYQRTPHSNDKIVIGWSGSVTTIQHFNFAIPFLKKIKAKYGDKVEIRVMGDPDYQHSELGIKGVGWSRSTEVPYLSSYDIGIMPLPDDQWTKGKCGLKGLSYMSLEIPTIMSPVGVNTEIIEDGINGFLAATAEEWEQKLSFLIENPDLRIRLGKAGRQTVIDRYSVISQRDRYLQYFREVLES